MAVTLAVGVTGSPPMASAAPHDFDTPIFQANARGDISTIGNISSQCVDDDPTLWNGVEQSSCLAARTGVSEVPGQYNNNALIRARNNYFPYQPVDLDGDSSTFSSSRARLTMPAGSTVLWAGLHWNGVEDVNEGIDDNVPLTPAQLALKYQMKLKAPGGSYTAVNASDTWYLDSATDTYAGYADVTNLVKAGGAGDYWGADVQTCTGKGGCFGSWSLTVAWANPNEPARNLTVWHGWKNTLPGESNINTVTGLVPPPNGPVNARLGVVNADGDLGFPDSFEVSTPSTAWQRLSTIDRPLNPSDGADWFNSTINYFGQRRPNSDAAPNYLANMNIDIAQVDTNILSNTDTSLSFRTTSPADSGEQIYNQVVHSAVEIYQPEISIDKTVSPAGPVPANGEVTWSLDVSNAGIDAINKAVVSDPLPAGVEYVPGSIRYASGGPAAILGTKTDGAGDDQADYDAATRTFTFRVGAGANGTSGGTMGVAPASDGSDQVTITFKTKVTAAPGASVTNTAHAYGEGRELDDPYGPLTTDDDDPATIAAEPVADLGITKTDGDAVVRKVGDQFTYTLEATNAGPSPATGVVITDPLDAKVKFVSSAAGCAASGQDVTCAIGNLAAGETKTVSFVVEVVTLPGVGKVIPNVAAIDGNEPNPDCDDAHPDALCNTDDEETPQPEVDLGITKSDGDAKIRKVGDEFTYTLEATNAGPDTATGVVITDPLDERLAFVSSDDGCAAEGQDVTCLIGDLAAGETKTVTFKVKALKLPDPGKTIPNVATITGNEPQPDCDDEHPNALCDTDDEETPGPTSDLGIKKNDGGHVIRKVGEKFTYTFTVTNKGPDDEPNAVLTDVLPAELRFVPPAKNCTADGQTVTCKIGAIKAGETLKGTIVVEVVKLPAAGKQVHNVASIAGDNPNPDCKGSTPKALCNEDPEDTPYQPPAPPKAPAPPTIPGTSLPRTGASVAGLTGLGLALLAGGAVLMASRRRRGLALTHETAHPHALDG
jgi:uncharacterized repeat protein (TIGR01451 family)/fimbrial isopeptide formation D2 family protein/LPXTG-motif cell wall-anchored protein